MKARIGDLVEISKGRKPAELRPVPVHGDLRHLQIEDLRGGSPFKYMPFDDRAVIVEPSDVVIAWDGANAGTSSYGLRGAIGSTLARLRPTGAPSIWTPYLGHYLASMQTYLRSHAKGATVPHLDPQVLNDLAIDLLPLPEQRRIAAILDHADGLRAKRRQVLAHLDTMPLAIFHEMFGDTCRNPLSFPTVQIRAIAKKFSDGPFGSNLKSSHYVKDGVPVIRLQNIGVGYYHDKDRAFVSAEHYSSLAKHDCQPGDILIATLGDPNLRACIHPQSLPLALNKADCIQFRIDPRVADKVWACWLLNSPGTTSLATSLAHGQTRTRIAMGQLRELKVPLPPLSLQREFAERITALDIARGRTIEASAADDQLFASLQSRAFRGEL